MNVDSLLDTAIWTCHKCINGGPSSWFGNGITIPVNGRRYCLHHAQDLRRSAGKGDSGEKQGRGTGDNKRVSLPECELPSLPSQGAPATPSQGALL